MNIKSKSLRKRIVAVVAYLIAKCVCADICKTCRQKYSAERWAVHKHTLAYSRYAVEDFDRDGNDEIVLIQLDSSDQSRNRSEYYAASEGTMTLRDTVPLSDRMGHPRERYH